MAWSGPKLATGAASAQGRLQQLLENFQSEQQPDKRASSKCAFGWIGNESIIYCWDVILPSVIAE